MHKKRMQGRRKQIHSEKSKLSAPKTELDTTKI
jgi:hypothetical protein